MAHSTTNQLQEELNPKYNQVHQKIREQSGYNTNYSKAYLVKQGSNPSPFVRLYVKEQMLLSFLETYPHSTREDIELVGLMNTPSSGATTDFSAENTDAILLQ